VGQVGVKNVRFEILRAMTRNVTVVLQELPVSILRVKEVHVSHYSTSNIEAACL
jgi:hypothetical protein